MHKTHIKGNFVVKLTQRFLVNFINEMEVMLFCPLNVFLAGNLDAKENEQRLSLVSSVAIMSI